MHANGIRAALTAGAAGAVLALGACGGSGGGSGGTTAPTPRVGGNAVSVRTVDGVGNVLVDGSGRALYFADQEARGMIACTGGCTKIWLPLRLPAGAGSPGGSGDLAGKLGTVERPDGSRQISWKGMPLYRFAEDGGPGTVSGDGAADSFGGTDFTWHAALAGKGGSPTATTSRNGYSY